MKWESSYYKKTRLAGTTRITKRFLFFPLEIINQWRWLETVYIKQIMEEYYGWFNQRWSDFEEWIDFKETNKIEIKSFRKRQAIKAIKELEDDFDMYDVLKEINSMENNVLGK